MRRELREREKREDEHSRTRSYRKKGSGSRFCKHNRIVRSRWVPDATISGTALMNNKLVVAQGQALRAATDTHTLSPSLSLFLTRPTIISDLSLS